MNADPHASTLRVRAVLFDFGGTLYDYAVLEPAERDSLTALARWAGIGSSLTASYEGRVFARQDGARP